VQTRGIKVKSNTHLCRDVGSQLDVGRSFGVGAGLAGAQRLFDGQAGLLGVRQRRGRGTFPVHGRRQPPLDLHTLLAYRLQLLPLLLCRGLQARDGACGHRGGVGRFRRQSRVLGFERLVLAPPLAFFVLVRFGVGQRRLFDRVHLGLAHVDQPLHLTEKTHTHTRRCREGQ